jgi:hypothetical protein
LEGNITPAMAQIPPVISNILLPSPKLSIISFIQFPTKLGSHLSATATLFWKRRRIFANEYSTLLADVLSEKPTSKVQNDSQVQNDRLAASQVSNDNFNLLF